MTNWSRQSIHLKVKYLNLYPSMHSWNLTKSLDFMRHRFDFKCPLLTMRRVVAIIIMIWQQMTVTNGPVEW